MCLPLYFEQGGPADLLGDLARFLETLPQVGYSPADHSIKALVKKGLRRILPAANPEILWTVGAGGKPIWRSGRGFRRHRRNFGRRRGRRGRLKRRRCFRPNAIEK